MPKSVSQPAGVPAVDPAGKAALLADLRARVRRLEGGGGGAGRVATLGMAELDRALPDGGLSLGCLHEVTAGSRDGAAATSFSAAVLARVAALAGPVVWVTRGRDLYAPGLAGYGLGPERLVVVRARRDADVLWAMEEVLRTTGLGAALGEVATLDLVASRRLQLAAETSGVTGLLLRVAARTSAAKTSAASAAVTRWQVASLPSRPDPGEPGVGVARWRVELMRCRNGHPGAWDVEWRKGHLVGNEPETITGSASFGLAV